MLEASPPSAAETRHAALEPRGPILVRLLLAGVAGCVPYSRIGEITTAVQALLKAAGPSAVQWVGQVRGLPPGTQPHLSDTCLWPFPRPNNLDTCRR